MLRRISALGAAAAAACLAAGVAQAATSYSGSVPNGGCDNSRVVSVSGPSRIDGEVASTSSVNSAYIEILGPNNTVEAAGSTASYDTTGGGDFSLRVCTWGSNVDPPTLQYTATYATGPAGQPALPRTAAEQTVRATATHDVAGSGAIRTAKGLAFFTVKMNANGTASVRVFNPRANTHSVFGRAGVHFLSNGASFTQGRMTLRIVQGSSATRLVFRSPHFKATGNVVKGSFRIV